MKLAYIPIHFTFEVNFCDAIEWYLNKDNSINNPGVCRMNHDAKYSGGIFRRRPSTASTSSRLSIQSGRSGSVSCPTSPRHSKHLPAIASISSSSTNLNDVLTATTSQFYDGPRHLHRSPSANTYNYRQQSSSYSYTGGVKSSIHSFLNLEHYNRPTLKHRFSEDRLW